MGSDPIHDALHEHAMARAQIVCADSGCDWCQLHSDPCSAARGWADVLVHFTRARLDEADRRGYERGQHEERTRVLEWCDTLNGGPTDGYTITLVEHAVGEGQWPEGGGDG